MGTLIGNATPRPAEASGHTWQLRVTDIKQYAYCPRVVYYDYCLPGLRPVTYKMEAGIDAQTRVNQLEERRSLRAYGLEHGERHYHVAVESARLGCVGQIDMVIETGAGDAGRLYPVDFKLTRGKPGRNFRLQLACYGLMLEETYGLPVPEGFLYLIPQRRAERIALTARLRREAEAHVQSIRAMLNAQRMPPATSQRGKCPACEFRRFCNDVI